MSNKILNLGQDCIIDRLYQGAETSVDGTNIISVDFKSPELANCLLDDIAALLEEPANARIAEPVLREALQLIAQEILIKS